MTTLITCRCNTKLLSDKILKRSGRFFFIQIHGKFEEINSIIFSNNLNYYLHAVKENYMGEINHGCVQSLSSSINVEILRRIMGEKRIAGQIEVMGRDGNFHSYERYFSKLHKKFEDELFYILITELSPTFEKAINTSGKAYNNEISSTDFLKILNQLDS